MAEMKEVFRTLRMKPFNRLFIDMSIPEYAIAASAVLALVMIAANALVGPASSSSRPWCCGSGQFETYRGPRA
jgi:hypothetical protein